MTDRPRTDRPRRSRRRLLVPLLGAGAAVWVVRRTLAERARLDDGWPAPRPLQSAPPVPPAPPVSPAPPVTPEPPAPPVPAAPAALSVEETAPPAPPAAIAPAAMAPAAAPATAPAMTRAAVARAVPTATAVASVTAPALPDAPFGPGSLRPLADGSTPDPDYTVKAKTATKVFHAPGGAYYTRTRADVWFRTADDARAAGFTERGPRRHR